MVTDIFAVIADRTRRDILDTLRSGDKAVGELVEALSASQPTVSKHLKVLRDAGLVTTRAQGQKRFYALRLDPLDEVDGWLSALRTTPVSPAPAAGAPAASAEADPLPEAPPSAPAAPAASPAPAAPAGSAPAAAAPEAPAAEHSAAAHAVPAGSAAAPSADGPGTAAPSGDEPAAGDLVLVPAAVVPPSADRHGADASRPAQIQRTVERTVERAAARATEIMANLPKFGRRGK
jgi:DNA-binding transcriptional ArsR family regulator